MQDPPTQGKDRVLDAVIADWKKREAQGIKTYGRPLETFNGRDALWDAYEECLDLCLYLRQAIMERESSSKRDKLEG